VADRRNSLEKHLGLGEHERRYNSYRREALEEHVGEALTAQNYAAAQVYALLLIAERLESEQKDVRLVNSDELAIEIAQNIAPDLHRIADSIG
jgi:hypothetical protein